MKLFAILFFCHILHKITCQDDNIIHPNFNMKLGMFHSTINLNINSINYFKILIDDQVLPLLSTKYSYDGCKTWVNSNNETFNYKLIDHSDFQSTLTEEFKMQNYTFLVQKRPKYFQISAVWNFEWVKNWIISLEISNRASYITCLEDIVRTDEDCTIDPICFNVRMRTYLDEDERFIYLHTFDSMKKN